MSLFNRFIESIIPAPDKDDELFPGAGERVSPMRRSTWTMGYDRGTEGAGSISQDFTK